MTTEIATVAPQALTQDQQQAWLGMAQAKNNLVAELTAAELNAQGILNHTPTNDHAAIDEALANYRKAHTNMVETRKTFTGLIDAGIIQPLMAFEKRVDPKQNEAYKTLENTSLQLRKAAEANAARVNAINQEISSFKSYVTSEYFRIAAQYRQDIRTEFTNQYFYWLNKRISPEVPQIKEAMRKITPVPFNTYQPRLLNEQQMMEAWQSIPAPNYQDIYNEMMVELDNYFANFDSDLAKPVEAAQQAQLKTASANQEDMRKAGEEAAVQTLIAHAETVVVEAPKIKRTYTIVVVESQKWATTVMGAFIANLPHLTKYIRVKSWAKLTIGQMAEYLAKYASEDGELIKDLEYQEIEK